jgi:hypothetical protein
MSCVLAPVAVAVTICPTDTFVTSSFTPAVTDHGSPYDKPFTSNRGIPLRHQCPAQRGTAAQIALCFRSCIPTYDVGESEFRNLRPVLMRVSRCFQICALGCARAINRKEVTKLNTKKMIVAVATALMLLVGAGIR